MPDYETHDYDVIVIGAGGAGLRAAIEAKELGLRTALVCKSLLGKAHTVMAEGGAAAAMGNVWPEDNWKVHFRDTMRGGKMLNNWRMAQLHAQEAPDRIYELERWGALFDRTKDGRILQRDFGGHRYARLAHVGDRTGLEMIRTLQQTGRGPRHRRLHGVQDPPPAQGRQRAAVSAAVGYWRPSGEFVIFTAKAFVLATGSIGKSWLYTSNSWESTGDGHAMAAWAGADMIDMEFVQFHPTGMVWPLSVRGILVTEGVRGDGGVLRNSEGQRFMFDYIPPMFAAETADTEEEADRWYDDHINNRRPPELLPRDEVARSINAEVKAGRGRPHGGVLPRHRHPPQRRGDPPAAALDVPPVQRARRRRHHRPAHGGRPHVPLHDGGHPRRRRDRADDGARALRRGRGGRGHARRQPSRGQLAVGPPRVRAAGRNGRGRVRPGSRPSAHGGRRRGRRRGGRGRRAPRDATAGRAPTTSTTISSRRCRSSSGIIRTESELTPGPRRARHAGGAGPEAVGVRAGAPTTRDGTWPRISPPCSRSPGWWPRAPSSAARAGAATPARTTPCPIPSSGKVNLVQRIDAAGRVHARTRAPARDAGGAEGAVRGGAALMADVTLRVWRGDDDGRARSPSTSCPSVEGEVVLDVIHRIQAGPAPDLACRWNCKAGKCGSCSAEINGLPKLMCMTRMDQLPAGEPVVVAPMRTFPIIRDLVTDVSFNYTMARQVPPLEAPGAGGPTARTG